MSPNWRVPSSLGIAAQNHLKENKRMNMEADSLPRVTITILLLVCSYEACENENRYWTPEHLKKSSLGSSAHLNGRRMTDIQDWKADETSSPHAWSCPWPDLPVIKHATHYNHQPAPELIQEPDLWSKSTEPRSNVCTIALISPK